MNFELVTFKFHQDGVGVNYPVMLGLGQTP